MSHERENVTFQHSLMNKRTAPNRQGQKERDARRTILNERCDKTYSRGRFIVQHIQNRAHALKRRTLYDGSGRRVHVHIVTIKKGSTVVNARHIYKLFDFESYTRIRVQKMREPNGNAPNSLNLAEWYIFGFENPFKRASHTQYHNRMNGTDYMPLSVPHNHRCCLFCCASWRTASIIWYIQFYCSWIGRNVSIMT